MKSVKRNSNYNEKSVGSIVKRMPADKKEEILQVIVSRGAVFQKDLRKELGGNCSRILKKLEEEGLIKRTDVVVEGKNTYLVTLANENSSPILANVNKEPAERLDGKRLEGSSKIRDGLAPCFGCSENTCVTSNCIKLTLYSMKYSKPGSCE